MEHQLYLAISTDAYKNVFQIPAIEMLIKWHQISLLIVDIEKEEVVEWIKN